MSTLVTSTIQVSQIQPHWQFGLADVPLPTLPEKGALIRMTGCGLCGSDLDKIVNKKANPGMVLGHEVVGVVDTLSPGHDSIFQAGDRIVSAHHVPCGQCHYCQNQSESMCAYFKQTNFVPGGFAQQLVLTQEHLQQVAFKVPADITDAEASCVEPLACVLRAVDRAGLIKNGSVLVVGMGFIGQLAAQAYLNQGYQVFGIDLEPSRLALAKQHGFITQGFDAKRQQAELTTCLTEATESGQVDVVFLTVVNSVTVTQALERVRSGGTIVVFTSAPLNQALPTDFLATLYFREINLITSYSPSLKHLKQSAELIFNRQIKVAPLVTHQKTLAQLNEAVDLYLSGEAIKVLITP